MSYYKKGDITGLFTEDNEIKELFIRDELAKHGEWLEKVFVDTLEKYHHNVTMKLTDSIYRRTEYIPYGYRLNFWFLDYGRFFDIEAYRKEIFNKKHNYFDDNINKVLWGVSENKKKKRVKLKNPFYVNDGSPLGKDGNKNTKYIAKQNKWYARTMYGRIGELCASIMYGLTENEYERLKLIVNSENKYK